MYGFNLVRKIWEILKKKEKPSHRIGRILMQGFYDRRLSPVSVNYVATNLPTLVCGAKIRTYPETAKFGGSVINN